MSKVEIAGLPVIDIFRYGIVPFPRETYVFPPSILSQPRQLLESYFEILDRLSTGLPLECLDPFKRWREADKEAVKAQAERFIGSLESQISQIDSHSRTVSSIGIAVYPGRRFSQTAWVLDLKALKSHILGEGCAVYTRDEGWRTTQRPGVYQHWSHLLVRQKKK